MRVASISVLFFFILAGCEDDKPRCVATMEHKVFFECGESRLQFEDSYYDSQSSMEFDLPEKWQLVENEKLNSSWVLFDTSRIFSQGSALGIILKKSDLSLKEYFHKEIGAADTDTNLAVIRAGRDQLGKHFCYWFQMERYEANMPPQHSVMYYMDGIGDSKVVVDARVYGTEQMNDRFCRLKQIANTIKVN